jgi:hypothetical protein
MKQQVAITKAYHAARLHKRWKLNTSQFSFKEERFCHLLIQQLRAKSYQIKSSLCFIAFSPVKREIFAGDFSDRIIHHFLFNKLNPQYDKLLIHDCYSCRQHKGTSFGIKRAAHFMQRVSSNYKKKAFVLKLDIKGYFMNIDRSLLYQQNKQLITRLYAHRPAEKNELLYLLKKVIFNDPTKNCRLRGHKLDWQGLPKNKSLFATKPGKGLPIGNLTSQLFGNIYLNQFDHFVKRKLKCKYYGRYVDDMIFFHEDKEYLKKIIPSVKNYLQTNLGLEIHEKKIYLQPVSYGLKFLGAIIKPGRIYPGPRLIQGFHRCLTQAAYSQADINQVNSYLGLLKQFRSFKLRKKYLNSHLEQTALKTLKAKINEDYTKLKPYIK